MLSFEPNVIIIDDKINEVKGIIDRYQELGIGCKYYNPNLIDGDALPIHKFSDVGLIFLDIYFTSNFHDYDPEFCFNWIQSIVPEKSFYILIIWTTDTDKGEQVLSLLNQRNLSPFCTIIQGKAKYKTEFGPDFNQLIIDINDELQKSPGLTEMGVWKNNIKNASNKVIGGLTKDSNPEIFNKKLQKIILCHGGASIINENINRKREVLFEALNQVLNSNAAFLNDILPIDQINAEGLYGNFEESSSAAIDRELNSWFHFNLSNNLSKDFIMPGLIAKNKNKFLRKLYSIQDDPKIENILVKQIEQQIAIEDIVLVINRPCDHAQNKIGKNIKLLSGLLLKNAFRYPSGKNKNKIHFNDKTLPDSVKKYEYLYFDQDNNDITLLFDFRYSFSIPRDVFIEKFENIKIFNKELLSEMQVEYSSYSSRLGITQII